MTKRQIYLWLGLHAFVLVVFFSLLFVAKRDVSGKFKLPLLPQSLAESEDGQWVARNLTSVAADLWIYYHQSNYILRGEVDPAFLSYKARSMEGSVLPSRNRKGLRLPYRDIAFEYPPVAFLFVLLPGFFSSDLYTYEILYSLLASLFCLWTVGLLIRIYQDLPSSSFPPSGLKKILAFSLAFLVCFGPLTVYRLDVFSVFFVTFALRAIQKNRLAWAGVFLALGVATKLYPLILFPLFFLYSFKLTSWKGSRNLTLSFLAVLLIIYLPVLLVAPEEYLQSLGYHSQRGVEIESLWASWAQIRHMFGTPVEVYGKYGSKNIAWSGEEWVKNSWVYFALAVLGLVYLQSFLKLKKQIPETSPEIPNFFILVHSAFLLILGLLITSKVLSDQFVLWLFPLFLLIGFKETYVYPLYLQVALASQAIYPFLFTDLVYLKNHAVVVLAWKNALLLFLFLRLMDWRLLFQSLQRALVHLTQRFQRHSQMV